jgi:putative exporter of polyketide antibiotics
LPTHGGGGHCERKTFINHFQVTIVTDDLALIRNIMYQVTKDQTVFLFQCIVSVLRKLCTKSRKIRDFLFQCIVSILRKLCTKSRKIRLFSCFSVSYLFCVSYVPNPERSGSFPVSVYRVYFDVDMRIMV